MRKVGLFGTLAFGLLTAGACNSDGTQPEPEPEDRTPVSPSVRQLLQLACDLSLHCCSRGEVDYLLGPFVDEESCTDRLFDVASLSRASVVDLASLAGLSDVSLLFPNLGALDQAAQEGRVVVDDQAFATCRAYLRDAECNEPDPSSGGCRPIPPPPADSPCDTRKLFVGQLAEGDVCTSIDGWSLDCAPGLVCGVGQGLGVSGRCVVVKQQDEACSLDQECDPSLYCSPLDGTCQRPRREGEVCVFADRDDPNPPAETLLVRCAPDLSCDPVTNTCVAHCQPGARCQSVEDCDEDQGLSCIAGRCGQPRAKGLPCSEDADCEVGLHCGQDVFDASQLVCSPPKSTGADCMAHDECDSGFCALDTLLCSPQAPVGSACPSGHGAECSGGACVREQPLASCFGPSDCPVTGVCDTLLGQCGTYCVAAKQDGATCDVDTECSSDACIAGYCRTTPLDAGVACEQAEDCASSFCSYDTPRVCKDLPLGLGSPCFVDAECESGVCFPATPLGQPECMSGSEAGELCGDADRPPCNPSRYYCDHEENPAVCAPLKETGDACKSDVECRGDCAVRYSRLLCTPAAPEGGAVCDGSEPTAVRPPYLPDESEGEDDSDGEKDEGE